MNLPMISVIITVYQDLLYLADTISSLRAQSFADFEVICVDRGSADGSAEILQQIARKDSRFTVVVQPGLDTGAAKNLGFARATGKYAMFLNSNDLFALDMLEKLLGAAEEWGADLAVCNFEKVFPNGAKRHQEAIHTRWLPADAQVFSYRDCPDYIMRVTEPVAWNKLYRADFLRRSDLKYLENSVFDELAIASVGVAAAEKVARVYESLIQNRGKTVSNIEKLRDAKTAILGAAKQAGNLPYINEILSAVQTFVVDHFVLTMAREIRDFSAPEAAELYCAAHETFNRPEFADVSAKTFRNPLRFRDFCTIRKHDYETMKLLSSRRIIVSLTSFPKRIGVVHKALESIYTQTRKAAEIVLWLAEEQFPGKERDLPETLLSLVRENRLTIRWCDDLKGHKKLIYALQEYTNDVVVTIDDDLIYPKDMLDALYRSYLLYPNAVSTLRAHLIMLSDDNKVLPYKKWTMEVDACIHQPSMQLMTSGGAGDLYPPLGYRKEFFDRDVILETCLWADNLWSKAMELASDVPVVLAKPFEPLNCVDGSQEVTLYQINGDQNQYDVQMEKISQWMDETYEPGILTDKLTADIGTKLWGVEAVSALLDTERKANRRGKLQAENKVKSMEAELKELRSRCQAQEVKLQQTTEKLECTENSLKQTTQKLNRARKQVAELEPLSSVGGQYRELGRFLREMKTQKGTSASWCVKYGLYILAWIPAKLMSGVNVYVRNGFKETLKRMSGK